VKTRIKIATALVVGSPVAYPFINSYAEAERGYGVDVFGGEEMLLLFGLFAALLIIVDGLQKRSECNRKATTFQQPPFQPKASKAMSKITLTLNHYITKTPKSQYRKEQRL
jgi:hypothetical protein